MYKLIIASCFLGIMAISCSSNAAHDYWVSSRATDMLVTANGASSYTHVGNLPFEIEVHVSVQVADGETKQQNVAKVEVDFGDGSGWEDVTVDWKSKQNLSLTEQSIPHTYTTPGEYTVRSRVTFADAEVIYCPGAGEIQYTVTVQDTAS